MLGSLTRNILLIRDLYQVTTSYFCAGFETEEGAVINAAPIIYWMIGKNLEEVCKWISKKKGSIVLVTKDTP